MRKFRLLLVYLPVLWLGACNKKPTLFTKIDASHSGITFNNTITESELTNPLNVVNIYNGGGVGVADFNNDGLQDLYFAGNMVPSKLYLNKGNFKFEDITDEAGVSGMGRWARGISLIDINNDGLMDIYVCNTISKDSLKRQNILYVNQGLDKNGIPHFKDMAAAYGLDMRAQSTMAYFFDYDNDGDLDMYLTVNEANNGNNPSAFLQRNNAMPSIGKLYRNDMDTILHHGVFHDVSKQAGITFQGYNHAATVCDINNDGWKDIYISDDFLSSNILYINNHDGTFTNRVKDYFKHTSYNSMGQDIIDINNDGLADVVELDMNPEDNYRKKMMLSANNYQAFQSFDVYGYQYQYVRNTLQVNQGNRVLQNDTIGDPVFSDIGFMSGISQTDWSWAPVVTDFNNDGYRDIIVTNGFPKDVSDHDFIMYRQQANATLSKMELLKQIPAVKLHNYAFANKGDLTFSDVTDSWGLSVPTFSNGAVYADLDNDGAMDLIINNINDEALVYRNTSRDKDTTGAHYLQVKFKGEQLNINGLGVFADIYYDHDKHQVFENNPYRGYLSSDQNIAHFGLGKITLVDSVLIRWPNGKKQLLKNVKADQVLQVDVTNAAENYTWQQPALAEKPLFTDITKAAGIDYKHKEIDFIDFDIQKLLPHKFSEYSPALAVGDIDGNGFDDIIIGGNSTFHPQLFLQQASGKFIQKDLLPGINTFLDDYKDEGLLLFDANGDGKLDLYIASGGYKQAPGAVNYQDRLYLNDGRGNFTLATDALPVNYTSKLCVRSADFNNDGKPDLFVSGRVDPWNYPRPVGSFIFRNDTENGHVKFTDVTSEVAPDLKNIGLVCDAVFTDFDNDGAADLILAGEWMPITFLKNTNGKFINVTGTSGVGTALGWWNSIVAGDFRHTGKMDYIVGNVGLNTFYQASDAYPVYVTAKSFDNNGSYNAIASVFLPDEKGVKKEYPAEGREDVIKQILSLKKRYPTYAPFASATMDELLTPEQRTGALRLKANMLQSCFLRNDGGGKFTMIPLPKEAQVSALSGMSTDDYDGDGNLDVLINGNDFGTELSTGRYDALNGLLLKGNGKGGFTPLSILQSGIFIPGNGKALVKLQGSKNDYLVAASQNRGDLKLFRSNQQATIIKMAPDEVSAVKTFRNGSIQKEEFYYGSSFLSQSARFISAGKNVASITITSNKGKLRTITLPAQ